MKIGIVFSGQGAQHPGMGKDLYDNHKTAREIFDAAGKQIKEWCFNGTAEMLRQTYVTQPSIYVVTMAIYRVFKEEAAKEGLDKTLELTGIAGFSLGEYSALTVAGTIDEIGKGIDIVKKRGVFMQEAGTDINGDPKGGMVAAFGNREKILGIIDQISEGRILEAVNFNSPVQTVVAGENKALEEFTEEASNNRIKIKKLSVSTAFHSKMMEPASEKLRELLLSAGMRYPGEKIYSNVTAKDMMSGFTKGPDDENAVNGYISEIMARQVKSPVYWQETIENIIRDGAEAIIEIGPGKTLFGLVKKINKEVIPLNVEDADSLRDTLKVLKENIKC